MYVKIEMDYRKFFSWRYRTIKFQQQDLSIKCIFDCNPFFQMYIMKTIEYNIRNIFTKHLIVLKLKYLIK